MTSLYFVLVYKDAHDVFRCVFFQLVPQHVQNAAFSVVIKGFDPVTDEPKLKCLKVLCIKDQFKESKAFSKSKKAAVLAAAKFITLSIN